MPDVRKQIATSDGAVKRRLPASVPTFWPTLLFLAAGCGPMIEAAPFPVRPDSVRPADLLGPYDGHRRRRGLRSADRRARPWPRRGRSSAASACTRPAGAHEFVTETGADGRYIVPKLDDLPSGASMRVRRFTLIVYHRGHVAWRSDRLFPGREARRDFSQRGSRVRLERWQATMRHAEHVVFLGGGARVRTVAAWELQAAALELEGQAVPAARGRRQASRTPAVATTKVPLDISKLLSDDEIRGVTGYVGKFEDGKLTDLPTTEFYDSRHFKAAGKTESYDVGLRVWRLGTAAAEVQYRKLMSTLPERQDDRRGRATPRSAPSRARIAGARLPGARTRRGRVDDLRRPPSARSRASWSSWRSWSNRSCPSCRPRRRERDAGAAPPEETAP